jgi:hypothetical protein
MRNKTSINAIKQSETAVKLQQELSGKRNPVGGSGTRNLQPKLYSDTEASQWLL